MNVDVIYVLQKDEHGFYLEEYIPEYLSHEGNKKYYIYEMDFDMTDKAQQNILFELGVLCGKGYIGKRLHIDKNHRLWVQGVI